MNPQTDKGDSAKSLVEKCEHIIGFESICDDGRLVYDEEDFPREDNDQYEILRFKFCPKCGRNLNKTLSGREVNELSEEGVVE